MRRSVSRASKTSADPQESVENFFPGIADVKWHEFLEKEETNFFILGIREEIFQKCMDICFEEYLEKQAVAFTVHCAYLAWCKVLDMYYMFKDPSDTDDPRVKESWEPDPEPEPSIIDSWGSECIEPLVPSYDSVKSESDVFKTPFKPELNEEMESLESCSFVSDLFEVGEGEYFYPSSKTSFTNGSIPSRQLSIFTKTLSMSRTSLPLVHPVLKECNVESIAEKKKTGKPAKNMF